MAFGLVHDHVFGEVSSFLILVWQFEVHSTQECLGWLCPSLADDIGRLSDRHRRPRASVSYNKRPSGARSKTSIKLFLSCLGRKRYRPVIQEEADEPDVGHRGR